MKKTPKLVLVLSAVLFCYGFLLGGQQLVLSTVSQQFGMGLLGIGTMVSVLHITSTVMPALMGVLADRIGKKKVLATFAVIFGIGCLLAGMAPWLWIFMGSLLIVGAGYSVCESLASAVCVDVSREDGARYINLTQCLLSVGAILGPMVMSNLPEFSFATWRVLYIAVGIPLVVLGLVLSRMVFPTAENTEKANDSPSSKALLLSPVFLCFMAAILIYVGLENGFGYFIEPLYEIKTTGTALSAYGISAYWAGMALARLVYSFVNYPPRMTTQLSFLAAGVLFVALILVPSGGVCIALCGVVGFAYGPIWTTIVAGAAERFPDRKASVTGLISASCGLAGILFPIGMGAIVESLDIRFGFITLTATALIGSALAFVLKRRNKQ